MRPPSAAGGTMTVIGPASEIGGRYMLLDRIASGGMGEVWRGVDEVLGRPVAVKLLRTELAADPTFRERFRNEARSTAGIGHPGIAWVFDYGEQDIADGSRMSYLVMELVEGEPLSTMLHRLGRLGPAQTLDVVAQAAAALQAAHDRSLVHRDVKPANLLVRPDGVLKITDFGIARAADAVPLTDTGQVMGSAPYLSPEQARGSEATPASDIYSLGVVAYECLAGTVPFTSGGPAAVVAAHVSTEAPPLPSELPGPVRELVMRMLAKDPAGRPHPAGALAAEAAAVSARLGYEPGALASAVEVPLSTRPIPLAERPTRAVTAPTPAMAETTRAMPAAAMGAGAMAVGSALPAGARPAPRRGGPSALLIATVLVILVGLAIVILLAATNRNATNGPTTTTTAPTTTTTAPTTTTTAPTTTTTAPTTTTTTPTTTTSTASTTTTAPTTPTTAGKTPPGQSSAPPLGAPAGPGGHAAAVPGR